MCYSENMFKNLKLSSKPKVWDITYVFCSTNYILGKGILTYCLYESLCSALYLHPEENIHFKPFITAFFSINMQIKSMSVLGKNF